MTFDNAFTELLGHEGGYSNHPSDPGGETIWGITVAVARQNGYRGEMALMPVDFAKRVYKKMYWDKVKCDEVPERIRYALFDAAVNSGTGQAVRWLQRAVGVADDGDLGPVTLAAIRLTNPELLLMAMLGQRLEFMTRLSTWPDFGRGWARRIAKILQKK